VQLLISQEYEGLEENMAAEEAEENDKDVVMDRESDVLE